MTDSEMDAMTNDCLTELASAKAAFVDLVDQLYEREAAYRSVIDGMTEWLNDRDDYADCDVPYKEAMDDAIAELDRLKLSALSTLGSLPPRDSDRP